MEKGELSECDRPVSSDKTGVEFHRCRGQAMVRPSYLVNP